MLRSLHELLLTCVTVVNWSRQSVRSSRMVPMGNQYLGPLIMGLRYGLGFICKLVMELLAGPDALIEVSD
jgi:hypothetical protein